MQGAGVGIFTTDVARVMVATDRSETATHAVTWAAELAERYGAELHVLQIIVPDASDTGEATVVDRTRADVAAGDIQEYAEQFADARARGRVVVSDDIAGAIVDAAAEDEIDVLVVGNVGMKGRREFLLGNVPNRISHNARCTVVIVNTATGDGAVAARPPKRASRRHLEVAEPRLAARSARIGAVATRSLMKTVLKREKTREGRQRQAEVLRDALEDLGPTFVKIGQILSTRPDLLPPEFIDELSILQDHVPPMSEAEVVRVMEEELGVPWEDVFTSIDPEPLAAASIGQVHRATLTGGERTVVKVQRPNVRDQIEEDLALLEIFAEKASHRPKLSGVIDLKRTSQQLADSLRREVDFRQEASNLDRMAAVLEPYDRLGVPRVHHGLSTSRLLVMEEVQGVPISQAPDTPARKEAARQLLESFYQQILTDGFFHADPHPGNLMWWKDSIYLLDLGMVGQVGADLRENLVLLLMAFWQQDAAFLTDVTLTLTHTEGRGDLDAAAFQHDLGDLMARYRGSSLRDIQLGPILQEMSELAMRYEVPLPAELTLTGKALAQIQLATAQLDPDLDPFDVAGKYLMRETLHGVGAALDPAKLLYQVRRFQVRAMRAVEAVERLIGARPGAHLNVNFEASALEAAVRRGVRRIGVAVAAAGALVATGLLATAERVDAWIPASVGAVAGLLTLGLVVDVLRRK